MRLNDDISLSVSVTVTVSVTVSVSVCLCLCLSLAVFFFSSAAFSHCFLYTWSARAYRLCTGRRQSAGSLRASFRKTFYSASAIMIGPSRFRLLTRVPWCASVRASLNRQGPAAATCRRKLCLKSTCAFSERKRALADLAPVLVQVTQWAAFALSVLVLSVALPQAPARASARRMRACARPGGSSVAGGWTRERK